MPDVVRHKKFKDDVFWVSYNNPDTGVKVDFLSIKFPENERKSIAGTLSQTQAGVRYATEKSGTTYETFVLGSSSILPLETFKEIAAKGLTTASGTRVLPTNISGNIVTRSEGYALGLAIALRCSNCQENIFQPNAIFCPKCGKQLGHVPQFDNKRGVPQV